MIHVQTGKFDTIGPVICEVRSVVVVAEALRIRRRTTTKLRYLEQVRRCRGGGRGGILLTPRYRDRERLAFFERIVFLGPGGDVWRWFVLLVLGRVLKGSPPPEITQIRSGLSEDQSAAHTWCNPARQRLS